MPEPELPINFIEPPITRNRQSRINRYLRKDLNMKKRSKQKQGFMGIRTSKMVQGPEIKLKEFQHKFSEKQEKTLPSMEKEII